MITAIQEKYIESIEKKKVSGFNNIESRKYNYNELERQLLYWVEYETEKNK